VFHSPVYDLLVARRECTLFSLLHSLFPARTGVEVFSLLGLIFRVVFSWGPILFVGPCGYSFPCKELEGELLEEILDDVHHIWADVPDHVEQVEPGQGAGRVDPGLLAHMVLVEAPIFIACFTSRDALFVGPWANRASVALGAEGSISTEAVPRRRPPVHARYNFQTICKGHHKLHTNCIPLTNIVTVGVKIV
jgi:hypothetical protein